ncbi:unnamed protein product [Ranitomeya imitator]|uniref:Ig-like domain-containing protein n=1 Tax=Ranitomeya imitator TaxID=111125 RepID=A0ABN9LGP3_9NEOB|nr:unnamed protein product [Ranitomeya imitator]
MDGNVCLIWRRKQETSATSASPETHTAIIDWASEMMRVLLLLLGCVLPPRCGAAVRVDQEVKLLMVKAGEKAELRCNQDQSNYFYMFWYQQKPQRGLTLMVLSLDAKSEDMETEYEGRWSLQRPTVYNSTLTLKASAREDGAVYFCAASIHSRRERSPAW